MMPCFEKFMVQRSTEKKRTQKKKNRYGDDFIVPFSL